MIMEKKDRLKKFEYDADTFESVKSRLVTWDLVPVEIIKVIRSTSGSRLVGVIEGDTYDQVFTFTSSGKCVEAQNPNMDLYIDESIELWFNLSISSDGLYIMASHAYYTEDEAKKDFKPEVHFDTVSVVTKIHDNSNPVEMPSIKSTKRKFDIHYVYSERG